MDKLHDCYIWHIITLATMKYKLRNLKGGIKYAEKIKEPSTDSKSENR